MVFRQSQQQAGGVRSDILSIDVRHQSNQPFRSPGHGRIQPQRCHRLSRRQQAVPRGERQEIRRNVAVDVGNGAQTESTSSLAAQPDLGLTKTGVVSSMDFQHGLHAAHVQSKSLMAALERLPSAAPTVLNHHDVIRGGRMDLVEMLREELKDVGRGAFGLSGSWLRSLKEALPQAAKTCRASSAVARKRSSCRYWPIRGWLRTYPAPLCRCQ